MFDQQDRVICGEATQAARRCSMPLRAPCPRAVRRAAAPTGFVASAIAISSARRSPCERSDAATSARSASPVAASASLAAAFHSGLRSAARKKEGKPAACACAASRQFSKAVNAAKMFVCWNVRASPCRAMRFAGQPLTSSPRRWIVPADGLSSPDRRFASVDLPAPFGPITAWTAPVRNVELDLIDGDESAEPPGETGCGKQRLSHPVLSNRASRASA